MNDDQIEKIIKNVEATLNLEGLELTEFAKDLNIKYLKGELSADEVVKIIKNKYKTL